jgi:transcriptional regulator with XRE-family HTH domain
LLKARLFGTHVSVPKKPPKESDLTKVRKGLGLSQPDFARRLGVSASMIKKLEEGKRRMTQDLQARIYAETGITFINGDVCNESFSYSKEDHTEWLTETRFNKRGAEIAARMIAKLAELMFDAASHPNVQKSLQVFNALLQSVERIKDEFQLDPHIEALLRDRYSTDTRRYSVRELRDNDLLAKMVGFKDDPDLKDDEKLLLTKTTGWFPTKELFNITWQHREFLTEMIKMQGDVLGEEAKAKAEQIEKQLDLEMDAYFKRSGLT